MAENTATETQNTETTSTGPGRGRVDRTPNKTFPDQKIMDNGDGTAVYKVRWNDENGDRQEKLETKAIAKRGGKRGDEEPKKVFTVKQERLGESNDILITAPFNDGDGTRTEAFVVLSVNQKGNLSAKVVNERPE